jgi:Protein of unknown function (DUF3339)
MIDLTSVKVLVPTILFSVLSPGLILSLPSTDLGSMKTSLSTVGIHALVLVILYSALARSGLIKVSITKMDLIVPAVLFLILTPKSSTNVHKIVLSTAAFALIFATLRTMFPQYY